MDKTIRELIAEYQNEIMRDLTPDRIADILKEISALYGNILDRVKDTEMIYNKVLLTYLEAEKVANRATIKSKITQEYQDLKDATNTEKLALKMISSLNKLLRLKENEYKTTKYQ